MTVEIIEQNIKSIVESLYSYETLLEEKKEGKEVEEAKAYLLKLADNLKKIIDKEKAELKNA